MLCGWRTGRSRRRPPLSSAVEAVWFDVEPADGVRSPTLQGDEAMTTLADRLNPQQSDRDRAREVLRAAGLLAKPSPEMRERAARSTATLEEVSAALSRAGGTPLSEIIIEQRGGNT